MVSRLVDVVIDDVSSVDKAANKHARVMLMKRDTEQEAPMSIIQKLLSDDPGLPDVVANLVAHGVMSGDDLDALLNKRAKERQAPGESFFQSFNKCFATPIPRDPVGQEMLGIRMAVTRGGRVAKVDAKPIHDKGDRKPHLADGTPMTPGDYLRPGEARHGHTRNVGEGKNTGDAQAEFDAMVDEYMAKNPGASPGKATEHVMRTPNGNAKYKEARAVRLNKAAALYA